MSIASSVADYPERLASEDGLGRLLGQVAQGDRSAFKSLYEQTSASLFGLAVRLMRSRELAEDLLQDTYLTIWQKASQYTSERGSPLAWMTMILRHRGIDRLRLTQRRPQELVLATPDDFDRVCGEAREIGSGLPGRDVARALEALPAPQRLAITLAFYEGLTHEELALRLQAPLGTVKSWVRRGLSALKESLDS